MAQRPAEQKTVLSLDIGHQNIKAIVTETEGENFVCHRAAVIEVPRKEENAFLSEFLDAVKKELTPWKFDHHGVRVCLSGDSVTVRFIQVPNITKAQLLSNISYESSKYIPFPLKDTYFDCDVFPPSGGAQETKTTAVIAAAKRDAVGNVAKILHAMGFYAQLLDVSPVALFNAFEVFGTRDGTSGSTFAILDVGSRKSHLGIVHEGTPAFARDLDVGGSAIDLVNAKAATDKEGPTASNDPAGIFHRLADEIRNSLRFFEAQQGTTSSSMVVTGGGALIGGLPGVLQQVLEIPVSVWNPFDSPRIRLGQDAVGSRSQGPIFGVCLGLVARTVELG